MPLGNPDIHANKSGIYHQCSQVNNDTNPGYRIPGPTSELNNSTTKVARIEIPPYQGGAKSNPPEITCDNPTAGIDNRETECSFPGSATCSVVLLVLQGDVQRALKNNNQNYNALLSLSLPAQEELSWWQEKLAHWNSKALLHHQETIVIK